MNISFKESFIRRFNEDVTIPNIGEFIEKEECIARIKDFFKKDNTIDIDKIDKAINKVEKDDEFEDKETFIANLAELRDLLDSSIYMDQISLEDLELKVTKDKSNQVSKIDATNFYFDNNMFDKSDNRQF